MNIDTTNLSHVECRWLGWGTQIDNILEGVVKWRYTGVIMHHFNPCMTWLQNPIDMYFDVYSSGRKFPELWMFLSCPHFPSDHTMTFTATYYYNSYHDMATQSTFLYILLTKSLIQNMNTVSQDSWIQIMPTYKMSACIDDWLTAHRQFGACSVFNTNTNQGCLLNAKIGANCSIGKLKGLKNIAQVPLLRV